MLKFSIECTRFDTIIIVQLGTMKIYVTTVEALKKKKRQDETQFTTKFDGFIPR
jgi:hypothetical protein